MAMVFVEGAVCRVGAADADAQQNTGVLVVDIGRVERDAVAAQSLRKQADSFRFWFSQRSAMTRAKLRAEEAELAKIRETLSREEFDARALNFEAEVRAFKRERSHASAELQRAIADGMKQLRDQLGPVLLAIMEERGAMVILDSGTVALSARALDITDEAIARINESVPEIILNLEKKSDQ
jgi:Skp family chaperone for outer membrane proteins